MEVNQNQSHQEIIDKLHQEIAKRDEIIKNLEIMVARLNAVIENQNTTIVKLNLRIEELERRLSLNSSNSGKPPSSDGLRKPPSRTQSLRKKSDKKRGGQPGHKGSTLKQVANPDIIEMHSVSNCPECKTDLSSAPVVKINKRQVFDIPVVKPTVTEHQFEVKCCPGCQKKIEAPSEDLVAAPVQYGKNIQSLVAYLHSEQLVPMARISQIMRDAFNLPLSVATIETITKTGANCVESVTEKIAEQLKIVPQKHVDESGLRIAGLTQWIHVLCDKFFVHYRFSKKRGDVPQDLVGVITHDHFSSYYARIKNVLHSLCNAHHLRELEAASDIDKEPWAHQMYRLLEFGNQVKKAGNLPLAPSWLACFRKLYDQTIFRGLAYHEKLGVLFKPARGRTKRRPGHNLLLRLQKRADDTLRFLHDPNVPFTNNLAERDLRMLKVKQKISGSFRTENGAKHFLILKSYMATAKKQGRKAFETLRAVFQKKPINLVPI